MNDEQEQVKVKTYLEYWSEDSRYRLRIWKENAGVARIELKGAEEIEITVPVQSLVSGLSELFRGEAWATYHGYPSSTAYIHSFATAARFRLPEE